MRKIFFLGICLVLTAWGMTGCSSAQYKVQPYATRQTSKTMEYDYAQVMKGIKEALSEYRLEKFSAEEGEADTEWTYSTSNDKYMEAQVNGKPRRKLLQTRYKFHVTAKKQIIGVLVDVKIEEEVERLKADGSFDNWDSVSQPDTARAHDTLESIERAIQAGGP